MRLRYTLKNCGSKYESQSMLLFAPDFRSGRQHFYVLALCYLAPAGQRLTLAIYGVDKMAARRAWRRVPESTLLALGSWAAGLAR
jgi:hypothetical protein